MDFHKGLSVTVEDVKNAHIADERVQDKYGVKYHQFWVNEEAGAVWLERLLATWPQAAWLNPLPEEHWRYTPSIQLVQQLTGKRMFPLTIDGLERAMRSLSK